MTKLYKITDKDGYTFNQTFWGEGVSHHTIWYFAGGPCSPELCTAAVIHAYRDIDIACLMGAYHLGTIELKLWEAEGIPVVEDKTKVGCYELTTLKQLPFPLWYQRLSIRLSVGQDILRYLLNLIPVDLPSVDYWWLNRREVDAWIEEPSPWQWGLVGSVMNDVQDLYALDDLKQVLNESIQRWSTYYDG